MVKRVEADINPYFNQRDIGSPGEKFYETFMNITPTGLLEEGAAQLPEKVKGLASKLDPLVTPAINAFAENLRNASDTFSSMTEQQKKQAVVSAVGIGLILLACSLSAMVHPDNAVAQELNQESTPAYVMPDVAQETTPQPTPTAAYEVFLPLVMRDCEEVFKDEGGKWWVNKYGVPLYAAYEKIVETNCKTVGVFVDDAHVEFVEDGPEGPPFQGPPWIEDHNTGVWIRPGRDSKPDEVIITILPLLPPTDPVTKKVIYYGGSSFEGIKEKGQVTITIPPLPDNPPEIPEKPEPTPIVSN